MASRLRARSDGSASNMELSPEKVAEVIASAATSSHPRSRYAVGTMAKTLLTTRRLLPDVAWDTVVRRVWPTPKRSA